MAVVHVVNAVVLVMWKRGNGGTDRSYCSTESTAVEKKWRLYLKLLQCC
jgi:hypothetical protein